MFNSYGQVVGLVWGGKHNGNLYKAVKIMYLDLSRFIDHDWSNYDENNDPNLAGPFMGESTSGKLNWSIAHSEKEAFDLLNSNRIIIPVDISADGNGVLYWVNKYHDPDYGQIELNFSYSNHFDKHDVSFRLTKHGEKLFSQNLKHIEFDYKNDVIKLIVSLDNGNYAAVMAEFDETLFKEFGHLK